MGRELKRVALDFDWPIDKVWDGFLNHHYKKCPHCSGGYSASYDALKGHINALMWDRAALEDANIASITTFLCGRSPHAPFGHDSSDAYMAIVKLGELAGLPEEWATCSHCRGEGVDPAAKEAYDTWQATEPPAGPGYQIWETVSEGSPISPVFATPEDLARWMAGRPWGADSGSSYNSWLAFIQGPGWAASMVIDSKGTHSGPEAGL